MKGRILFLTPYPFNSAASQRFRFEQYYELLQQYGYEIESCSFLDEYTWSILYKPGRYVGKCLGILKGFLRRLVSLTLIRKFDYVFIHREVSPIGPPIFEWIIFKFFNKRVVFDFDDAIWLSSTSSSNNIISTLRFSSKFDFTVKRAYKVSAANKMLADYVVKLNSNVIINPTTLDTEGHHGQIKMHVPKIPTIGWTGTHSTLKYLHILIPILNKLKDIHQFTVTIISDQDPDFKNLEYEFVKWNVEREIEDLLKIDIGVMPLYADEWSQGKSGFKALQYMSLGIPAVVSNVGTNKEIVISEVSGYLCDTDGDWEKALTALINSHELRAQFGKQGRQFVEQYFSVKSNGQNFLYLFQ